MLLIDAANVVGSRPTGWWRDRPGAARELTTRVRQAAAAGTLQPPVVLVLEGQAKQGVEEGVADGVEVVHTAGRGRRHPGRAGRRERSAGRARLGRPRAGRRARRSGAEVVGPTWLLDQLPPGPRSLSRVRSTL